jgi:hypothetical protein
MDYGGNHPLDVASSPTVIESLKKAAHAKEEEKEKEKEKGADANGHAVQAKQEAEVKFWIRLVS